MEKKDKKVEMPAKLLVVEDEKNDRDEYGKIMTAPNFYATLKQELSQLNQVLSTARLGG